MAIGHFTHTGSNIYLNHILRGQQKTTSNNYLAPFITTPSKLGPGAEPTNGPRLQMAPEDWSVPTAGDTQTIRDLVFPRSTLWRGDVVGLGVFNSSVGGQCLAYFIPDDGELIEVDDALVVLAGGLRHRFTAGFFSLALQNNILQDLYRAIPLPAPANHYLAHYTSAPAPAISPTAGGIEPTDTAYARQPVTANGVDFGPAAGGRIESASDFEYLIATASQGTPTHWGLHSSLTAGTFLLGGTISDNKAIAIGDQVIFPAGSLSVSLDA